MFPKVSEKLGLRRHQMKDGLLGVEVEVEGSNLPYLDGDWRTENDHSLRGESREYVMREPRSLDDTHTVLENLNQALSTEGTEFIESVRAGVHVHLNVQDLNVVEMYNLITIYYIVEDILVHFCGETREGNLFCLRASDAEYQITVVEEAVKEKRLDMFNDDIIRYSALNLCSLSKYGSLEFRAMRSTNDFSVLHTWCSMVAHLKEMSKKFNNPLDVYTQACTNQQDFLSSVFPSGELDEKILVPFGKVNLDNNLDLVLEYVTQTNWDSFGEVVIGGASFPVGTEFPDEPMEDF